MKSFWENRSLPDIDMAIAFPSKNTFWLGVPGCLTSLPVLISGSWHSFWRFGSIMEMKSCYYKWTAAFFLGLVKRTGKKKRSLIDCVKVLWDIPDSVWKYWRNIVCGLWEWNLHLLIIFLGVSLVASLCASLKCTKHESSWEIRQGRVVSQSAGLFKCCWTLICYW